MTFAAPVMDTETFVVSLGGCLGWDGETKAKVISEVEFGRRLEDFSFFRLAVV